MNSKSNLFYETTFNYFSLFNFSILLDKMKNANMTKSFSMLFHKDQYNSDYLFMLSNLYL